MFSCAPSNNLLDTRVLSGLNLHLSVEHQDMVLLRFISGVICVHQLSSYASASTCGRTERSTTTGVRTDRSAAAGRLADRSAATSRRTDHSAAWRHPCARGMKNCPGTSWYACRDESLRTRNSNAGKSSPAESRYRVNPKNPVPFDIIEMI